MTQNNKKNHILYAVYLCCHFSFYTVRLFEDAAKVTVLSEESCSECEAQLMKVEYKEGKSKLSDDKLEKEGCIFCDQELSQLVEKQHAVFMKKRMAGGGRGRGRGRGRGGRRTPQTDLMRKGH